MAHMPDEKGPNSPSCQFHVESMKQMANDIRELNKKVESIPVLITKMEQFIQATVRLQDEMNLVGQHNAKILLLENKTENLEKENVELKKTVEDQDKEFIGFIKDKFDPLKDKMTMLQGMGLLLPFLASALTLVIQHVWK